MTFLPIVERELRVAARKRSTFWVRIGAALAALIIASGFLLLVTVGGSGAGAASFGRGLFATLTWMSLVAALAAGLFFTSDCLSEEKREGTIGFLFLTDLRGYDVVLGKLLATSLRGFYALLAVFPIVAVTLLLGGVTGAQFWKTALALLNALIFSLAAGMLISAISRESQKALAGTLFVVLLFAAGGPAIDAILAKMGASPGSSSFSPGFSFLSPGYLFVTASAWGRTPFWLAFLINQICAFLLLGCSCMVLPRTWQEKAIKESTNKESWAQSWKFGVARGREARRKKLMALNPVLWLACRERWQASLVWALGLLKAAGIVAMVPDWRQPTGWFIINSVASVFSLMLYLGLASQVGRFFVESHRSGLLELLLATPLSSKEIVQGHWKGMVRMFWAPLTLFLAGSLVAAIMVQQATWSRMAAAVPAAPAPSAVTNAMGTSTNTGSSTVVTTTRWSMTVSVSGTAASMGSDPLALLVAVAVSVAGTLVVVGNLAAISWFGMWMGLNSKNQSQATLKTIAFVQVVPWMVVSFAAALAFPLLMFWGWFSGGISMSGPRSILFYPLLTAGISAVLSLGKDIGFIVWSRRRLYSDFRERMIRAGSTVRLASPPPLPTAAEQKIKLS